MKKVKETKQIKDYKKYIWIGVAVLVILYVIGSYNGLVSKQEGVMTAWGNVENQYQRRIDLIPNLVATVKGYAAHESDVLTEVTKYRSQWGAAKESGDVQGQMAAAQGLESALARLMVVVEKYPDLKANQNFLELQDSLEGTENRIAVERKRYNEEVKVYNVKVRKFPTNMIAGIFNFDKWEYFEADEGAEKAPQVEF